MSDREPADCRGLLTGKLWLLISALFNPMKSRMKVVLSVRVGVSGVLVIMDSSTDTTGHYDGWWFWIFLVIWIY